MWFNKSSNIMKSNSEVSLLSFKDYSRKCSNM